MKPDRYQIVRLSQKYRVDHGRKFRLRDFAPEDTGPFKSDKHAAELLATSVAAMSDMQEKLYAQDKWALLLIFQAMDAAGKDGTIKHVMSGINPQGCRVTSFKAPSTIDLDHDFLWRSNLAVPERGQIGIFNRSYYEEVLVVRVHKKVLQAEKLPGRLVNRHLWKKRFEDIVNHERYLGHNGIITRKFFLHLSKAEQKQRFLARLDEPCKNWKFSAADLKEREYWDDYQEAYEETIRHTSRPQAPWYVVPADNKWFTHLIVAGAIIEALESLDLQFPKIDAAQREVLREARAALGK
jgi:PPK2 family polyphosphate:nucleotide phosphotransferase